MGGMRKNTAILPAALIESAMEVSGVNLTETLRTALCDCDHRVACRRLFAMRGQVPFELDWRTLRGRMRIDRRLRRTGHKAALGDALLALACLDADLPLLTEISGPSPSFRTCAWHWSVEHG
jgi:predicted nucleic acid-binding protein